MSLTTSSWSAISRGAVIHGFMKLKIDTPFSVDVGSRISRANYGVMCEELFDDNLHPLEDKVFDNVLQKPVAIRVMKWHVVQVRCIKNSVTFSRFLT